MKKNFKRNILLVVMAILVIIQFIPVSRTNPPVDQNKDFIAVTGIDATSAELIKNACYDCHSNESKYPWYSYVAPLSFWVVNHINEGREELNFSEWADYAAKKKDHKLEECAEALTEGWMPLNDYKFMHPEARLTTTQRKTMADAINNLRARANTRVISKAPAATHKVEHNHSGRENNDD